MHLNKFDLNLLIALDALLQEKNVTRAAERVYVSQPAMSAALQKLRDYFNDALLVRAGRELCLTPRGLSLVEPVREALLHVQATLGTQPTFDPATVRRGFSVIVRDHIVPRLMPVVLRRLLAEAPHVTCAVEELSQTSLSRLEYGDSDLAVMLDNPQLFGLQGFPEWLRIVELRTVRWVCVVCRDHPYIREELTPELYASMPHMVSKPQGPGVSLLEIMRRYSRMNLDVRVTTQSPFELPFIVPGTPLIATVPENVANRLAPLLPIRTFAPPHEIPDSREILIWHKRNESDPGHAWLRDLFIECSRQN
jgi:LysR family transcriptional regulator, nod-box dependent transcriptional activator